METVLNSDEDHAEMLALHIDACQRGRLGKLSEKESEDMVHTSLELLRYMAVSVMASLASLYVISRDGIILLLHMNRTRICSASITRCCFRGGCFRKSLCLTTWRNTVRLFCLYSVFFWQCSIVFFFKCAGISRMNALCGPQYTKKLSDMYQDLIVSEDASRVRMMPYAAFVRRVMLTQDCFFLTGICPAL
jgi:hypothetical protein